VVLRVLHLVGSAVDDFHAELSRLYAADCLRTTADPSAYDVHVAYVSPGGRWSFPADLSPDAVAAATPMSVSRAIERIDTLGVDVMVPQMFCRPGMTSYRALFDVLGIPYVGNPPEVMALTADKARAKAVVAAVGVRVPPGEVLRPGERPSLLPPVVCKPVDTDNSTGVSLVTDPASYAEALSTAFAHAGEVLVEQYVELGREVRCGVLEVDGELVCLPLEEYAVDRERKPIRGSEDKLARPDGSLALVAKDLEHAWIVAPSRPPDPVTEAVHAAARACHRALGCRDFSLFDFRIDPDGRPWFLEAGPYCSFAATSVVSTMAEAAGIPVAQHFATALHRAVARGPRL
jgi:D-alanine-D-alanine ligase